MDFSGRSSRGLALLLAGLTLLIVALLLIPEQPLPVWWVTVPVIFMGSLTLWLVQVYRRSFHAQRWDRLTRRCRELPYLGVALLDLDHEQWSWNNRAMGRLLGVDPDRMSWASFHALLVEAEREAATDIYVRFKRGELSYHHVEHWLVRQNDQVRRCLEFDLQLIRDEENCRYLLATAYDITEQRLALNSLQRQRDLYEMLSQTNQAIVRARDRQSLLQSIVSIAVRQGHIHHAWIGSYRDEKLVPLVWESENEAELLQVLNAVDKIGEKAPTIQALKANRIQIWNVVDETVQMDDQTRRLARLGGIQAVAALPLHQEGELVGNLTLYSSQPYFFDQWVMRTLAEMASDISFSLANLARRQKLETANQIIESSSVVVLRWSLSAPHTILFVSGNVKRWGYEANALIGRPLDSLIFASDQARFCQLSAQVVSDSQQRFRLLSADGAARWVEAQLVAHSGAEGPEIEALIRDVQARKEHEERLQLAGAVFQSTREGVVVTDDEQRILEVNRAFSQLLGYEPSEVIGETPRLFSSGRHDAAFYRRMWDSLDRDGSWQGEIWNRRKDGTLIPELLTITRVDDPDGGETRYVAVFADVTEIKRSSERIEFLAHNDPVTELPNRTLFLSLLDQALRSSHRHQNEVALLILDLDHFKDVNDSYGHAVGDELLQLMAVRMGGYLRESDTLARLGGDEFGVMLVGSGRRFDASRVAEHLIALMSQTCKLSNGVEIKPGVSIGISLSQSRKALTAQDMLQEADAALYRAKSLGRGSYSFFSEELTREAARRVELEVKLRRVIENEQLEVHYQPQVDIVSGRVVGAEALVRWPDAERGYIPPAEFIPLAEQSGLINILGDWVLQEVCRQGAQWIAQGHPPLPLAVNLSPGQLRSERLTERIATILERCALPAQWLELELTEGALMHDPDTAELLLSRLRKQGMRLALDDFGTGYSSLAYLRRFPLDVLKIDKSFVDALPHEPEGTAIARTIVAMGRSLGMRVLAEGVETQEQLDALRAMSCDTYQGYLCSPALPPEQFIQFVSRSRQSLPVE